MADIDFKNSVNADTAYVDGHKVKLIAIPDGSLELPISANDEYGYIVDGNGKKHRVLLATFLEGDVDYKPSAVDTAYMTINSQKVKVSLAAKLNGTQYLSNSANVNDCYTEDDDGNKHRTILVSEPTGTLELPTSETSDSAYVIDNDGNKHKVRLFAVLAGGTTVVEVTVSGVPPLNLLGAVEDSLSSVKAFGGTELDPATPDPATPSDIYCNNGALKILDKSQWTIFTNPTSIPGKGVWIDTNGKWKALGDNGAGCAIPLTIGKQYTLVIHKKTTELGTMLRYGQSPQATPTSAGIQLTDWYRGDITDGQMISFVAKLPYLVMQLSAVAVEAGMVQEAVEVLEAQGGDYTMLEYLVADGNSWVETNLSGATRWVGAGQATSESTGSKCILGASTSSGNASVYLASRFGSSSDARNKRWTIDGASGATSVSGLTYAKYDIDYQENTFTGTINAESTSRTNTDTFTTWFIGTSRGISGGVTVNYPFVGSIYRQQAYQNGVLVGDFIPAKRNSDNVVGMYDTVSGTFFTNAGTGTFVAGTPLGDGEVLKLTPSNDTAGVANLLKINNYVDTQEILTGLINHQLGIYVLDGTEDWTEGSTTSLSISKASLLDTNMFSHLVCTHFVNAPVALNNDAVYKSAGSAVLQIRYDTASDLAAFKSWLATQYSAGTPVIVVYGLETPQDEVAPVPQTMQVVAGDNVLDIVQAGMSGLEVSATYMKGVSVTISEIEDANIGNSVEVVIA